MQQQCKQRRSGYDEQWIPTHPSQDPADQWVNEADVREDAEEENREQEHRYHRSDVLQSREDKGAGTQPKPRSQRSDHRKQQ